MKSRTIYVGILLSIIFVFISHAQQVDFRVLKGPYLGQKPPEMTPEIFAPNIVSTGLDELNSVFSPDGKEFYFAVQMPTHVRHTMLVMKIKDGVWTKPQVLPFTGRFSEADPAFSFDGSKLFFTSLRSSTGKDKTDDDWDIWFSRRGKNGWNEPENLGEIVNSSKSDVHPSLTKDGTLYFSSRRKGGFGKSDIYRSRVTNGVYIEPENLGSPVNTEYIEGDIYVSPDENYIIFASTDRPGGFGRGDLYISFSRKDGSWTKPVNMGSHINSDDHEYTPFVSFDGKYLFFTSFRKSDKVMSRLLFSYEEIKKLYNSPGNGEGDIYWVDVEIIEEMKPQELN